MLAVVPITGLLLAGCGGSSSDGSGGEEPLGLNTTASASASPAATASDGSTERFDITVITVCDTVQSVMSGLDAKAKPAQVQSALRKGLNSAFKASTTPKETLADVKVDRMLNQGCPAVAAQALKRMRSDKIYDFATLASGGK